MRSFLGAWTCNRQTYMPLVCNIFFPTISACRPNNIMSKGPLFEAAEKGDVKASIAVIRVTGHMQAKPAHSPTGTHTHPHSMALTHRSTYTPSRTLIHSLTHTHSYKYHTHTHSLSLSLSHTHTLTHSLTHIHKDSLTHTHSPPSLTRPPRSPTHPLTH